MIKAHFSNIHYFYFFDGENWGNTIFQKNVKVYKNPLDTFLLVLYNMLKTAIVAKTKGERYDKKGLFVGYYSFYSFTSVFRSVLFAKRRKELILLL